LIFPQKPDVFQTALFIKESSKPFSGTILVSNPRAVPTNFTADFSFLSRDFFGDGDSRINMSARSAGGD
jgi:hypothetical protein